MLALLGASLARAEGTDKAAHFGVSYAAASIGYGLSKKAFRLERGPALTFSAFVVLAAGFTKEGLDCMQRGDSRFDSQDMLANTLGVGISALTTLVFEF